MPDLIGDWIKDCILWGQALVMKAIGWLRLRVKHNFLTQIYRTIMFLGLFRANSRLIIYKAKILEFDTPALAWLCHWYTQEGQSCEEGLFVSFVVSCSPRGKHVKRNSGSLLFFLGSSPALWIHSTWISFFLNLLALWSLWHRLWTLCITFGQREVVLELQELCRSPLVYRPDLRVMKSLGWFSAFLPGWVLYWMEYQALLPLRASRLTLWSVICLDIGNQSFLLLCCGLNIQFE